MSHLISDIGATHARFALRQHADQTMTDLEVLTLPTGQYADAAALVGDALSQLRAALPADPLAGACFAVAGPVIDGRVRITNGGLSFAEDVLTAQLGAPVRLVNDFYALGMAVPGLRHLERIGGVPAADGHRQVKALIGPGSGLGMGILIPEPDGWRALPSEGGHADLAPGNHLEQEVLGVLRARHDPVCWETVLSGPGLLRLYEAVAELWGMPPRFDTPEEVSARGVQADDPVCHQTLELFFGMLGAAAGNLALTLCALGGVYIGGGIVPALRDFALTSPLRRRFDERAELEDFIAAIPLFLIMDEYPGLQGAMSCLGEGA
jgi:glucokinase